MQHRAIVCKSLCKEIEDGIAALEVVHRPREELAADGVRISVKAVALNFFDLLQLVGKYQVKPPLPFVPCTEGAGIVSEVGADTRGQFKIGDRVAFKVWSGGAASEEVVVSAADCILLPATLSLPQAAGYQVGYVTAYHALVHRGELKKGETLLVTGAAGGMGLAAVQVGKLLGATVIAAASDDKKLQRLKQLGADHIINYKTEDLKSRVQDITNGEFANVIYEPVGGAIFDQSVRCIAGKGRLLVIGFASGTIPTLPVNLALIKGFSLVGVRAGAQLAMDPHLVPEMGATLMKWATAGQLTPYVETIVPLERFKEAFRALNTRSVIGKAVIEFSPTGTARL
eukprot:TRINITY_DN1719_c0_g1_i1.p3 TRINITY_DN1719_c0_g1~~TRINITY_DN1719_c0_g1_i1.p3  ORF type:complete len:342 (-),score=66.26 TRINITY_DN1719_c0_g1_i1:2147-3172(-)